MRRWRLWFIRRDLRTETQRAMVVVLLVWLAVALGAFVGVWSVLMQHSWNGVLQGVALVVLALAIDLQRGGQ